MHLNQIRIVSAILLEIEKQTNNCPMIERQIKAVIDAENLVVAEFAVDEITVEDGAGLEAWLASDKTGMSSRYMACILAQGDAPDSEYAHPHDAADFGRCVGLLDAVPELRARILEMQVCSEEWFCLVVHWEQLEVLWKSLTTKCDVECDRIIKGIVKGNA